MKTYKILNIVSVIFMVIAIYCVFDYYHTNYLFSVSNLEILEFVFCSTVFVSLVLAIISVCKKVNLFGIIAVSCSVTIILYATQPLWISAYYYMSRETPENTLAVFYDDFYLVSVGESEGATESGGDYYIDYTYISGNYPGRYDAGSAILHIIPENNIYKIEEQYMAGGSYEKGKCIISDWGTGKFEFVGYSNDENLIVAKILEYYLGNKDKTEK
jgi:hypothetical protein